MKWDGTYMKHSDDSGTNYYSFMIESEFGCPQLSTNTYWLFMKNFRYVCASVLLIFGLFTLSVGRIYLYYGQFISTIIAPVCLNNTIAYQLLETKISAAIFWLILVASVILGLMLALFQSKHKWIGSTIIASWTGLVLGEAFGNLLFFQV